MAGFRKFIVCIYLPVKDNIKPLGMHQRVAVLIRATENRQFSVHNAHGMLSPRCRHVR